MVDAQDVPGEAGSISRDVTRLHMSRHRDLMMPCLLSPGSYTKSYSKALVLIGLIYSLITMSI